MTPERFGKIRDRLLRRQPDLTILAENAHKSHNIAAILRTADAVGLYRIHAVQETGKLRHHHMVSGGSRKWVPVELHANTEVALDSFKEEGFRLMAAHSDPASRDYRKVDYTRQTAILTGSESRGVSRTARQLVDEFVAIPMEGMGTSLNVSIATSVIIHKARRQREAAHMYGECRLSEERYEQALFECAYPEMAVRCRENRLPYPAMNADGDIVENPFRTET